MTGRWDGPVEQAARLLERSAGQSVGNVPNTQRVPFGPLGSGGPPELRVLRRAP